MGNNKFIDITGQQFNSWTVINYVEKNKYGKRLWNCKCICGKEKVVTTSNLQNNAGSDSECFRV